MTAGLGDAPVQLVGEEQVGELAVAVVLAAVRTTTSGLPSSTDSSPRWWATEATGTTRGVAALQQARQQQAGQREVAEVVGAELELVAVLGLAVLRRRHHPGVVDQQVERALEPVRERVHGRLRGEVELLDRGACPGIFTAASRPESVLRQASTTSAPCSASAAAVWKPMPELAPVTTARGAGQVGQVVGGEAGRARAWFGMVLLGWVDDVLRSLDAQSVVGSVCSGPSGPWPGSG